MLRCEQLDFIYFTSVLLNVNKGEGHMNRSRVIVLACALIGAIVSTTDFASAQIVALGHSAVRGRGDLSEMWPAQLEALLRAKGSNAHITNAGVWGETTGEELARVSSAVPDGTRTVILAISPFNDLRRNIDPAVAAANIAAIKSQLKARGIRIVDAMGVVRSVSHQPGMLMPDGIHLNVDGNRKVAAALAGMVR
jgi:acyl-CoA thioesterase-1